MAQAGLELTILLPQSPQGWIAGVATTPSLSISSVTDFAVTFPFLLPLLTCVPLKAKFLKFFRSFFPTDRIIHNNLRTGLNLKH